jgi:hypothetical protein
LPFLETGAGVGEGASARERMIVERRLQVTKKKTVSGLSMKTLEGVISYVDDGVRARDLRLG